LLPYIFFKNVEKELVKHKLRDVLNNDCTSFDKEKDDKKSYFFKVFHTPVKTELKRELTFNSTITKNFVIKEDLECIIKN